MKTKNKNQKAKKPFKQTLLRIFREHKEFKKPVLILVLINLFATIFSAAGPLLIGKIVDEVVLHESWNQVLWYLGFYGITVFMSVGMAHWRWNHETKKLDWHQHNALVRKTFAHLLDLSIGQLRNQHSVVTSSKVSNGQGAVRQLFDGIVYQLTPTLLMALVSCIAMSITYPVLGAATSVLCAVMIAWTAYIAKRTYRPLKRAKEYEYAKVNKPSGDTMRHMTSVMLAVHEKQSLALIESARQTATRNHQWVCIPMGKLLARMWTINMGGRVFITGLAAWYIYQGDYKVGALAAITSWLMQSLGRLQDLQQLIRGMLQSWVDSEIYFEIRDTKPAFEKPENAVVFDCIEGNVSFRNVFFTYEGVEGAALVDISLDIEAGQTVGIVGLSGAGKSTLLAMLQGAFRPALGHVMIDGVDICNIDLERYRQQVGFVEQETIIFDWTLYENLLFGVPESRRAWLEDHPEEVESVLKEVGLEHLISRLKKRMGETGRNLSGGEKQRVAIARVALKQPDMLIVDEGTSSVDPNTERRVHELLSKISPGSTRIFVAHRLATVQDADLIVVMDKGKVLAKGTHAQLLQTCELYDELVRNQLLRV